MEITVVMGKLLHSEF